MTQRYDLVIAGGGPSGSAAAWQAAQTGAKVVVLDKAEFPRDKPCGDGLTARAVSYLQKMGLADEVATFHRVNRVTVFSPSQWELSFPKRPGMPDHGHTVSRTHLDTVLLKHAESAGAEVRQGAEVTGPELDANGRVIGVTLKGGEKVYGDAVIAADGAYSPIKRALKIDSEYNGYSAIAIRSEMHANRPDSDSLDIYLKLAFQGDQLPGYGWVFPMGNGVFNIGLGYVNSYKNWQSINATQFLGEFLRTLPRRLGAAADRGAEEEQERAGVAAADGLHRVAAVAARRAVHRRLARRGQAGVGRGHLQGAGVRVWPRASARSRRCRTAAPTTSPTTRSAWKPPGAGSTGAAATSTSWRASRRREHRHQAHRQRVLPRPDAQGAVQEGTGPAAQQQVAPGSRVSGCCTLIVKTCVITRHSTHGEASSPSGLSRSAQADPGSPGQSGA